MCQYIAQQVQFLLCLITRTEPLANVDAQEVSTYLGILNLAPETVEQ